MAEKLFSYADKQVMDEVGSGEGIEIGITRYNLSVVNP